jgi:ribonuclease T1
MESRHFKNAFAYLAVFIAVLLAIGFTGCSDLSSGSTPSLTVTRPETATISAVPTGTRVSSNIIDFDALPPEGRTTLQIIKSGGPFPYSKDGAVFNNYEGLLPEKPAGYYHEYTVITPGSPDRGARRIIQGVAGEYYYTDDHYGSFKRIRE